MVLGTPDRAADPDRIERVVGAAVRRFENAFFAAIDHQLSPSNRQRLDALLTTAALDEPDADLDLNGVLPPSAISRPIRGASA